MKHRIKIAAAYLLIHVFLALPAAAGFCVAVEGEVDTTLTVDDFEGSGVLIIGGRSYAVTVGGINFGFTETEDDGTEHAVTSTEWHTPANGVKFTSFEDARLEPTDTPGIFLYVGRSRIKTGNGRYDCGEMVVQGEVDFSSGIGSFPVIRGKLCRCQP